MSIDGSFPEEQRGNLLQSLTDELAKFSEEEGLSIPKAFAALALRWLAEDDDAVERLTDGSGDRGLDAYQASPGAITIYQFKARETLDREELTRPGGPDVITDVPRLISLLTADALPEQSANPAVRRFLNALRSQARVYAEAGQLTHDDDIPPNSPLVITLRLVTLTNGLTTQASEELRQLRIRNEIIMAQGTEALFDIELISLDQFVAQRWKESNTQWKDSSGKKDESIRLHVEGQRIKDKTSMIFYTKAIDLIDSFNRFGYQLFEPNVRCQITNSRVNKEISKQIETEKGILQFKYLNNGVTLVYGGISEKEKYVSLSRPGIVNGLQTVTTLASRHSALPADIRKFFDDNCLVLVRIYNKQSIFVPTLVKATNNQNPMEARNLRSNDPEQILLEQRFSELGWFYERKDFAWDAFTSDESSWPTLKGVSRRNFQVQSGQAGRPFTRRVDNQDIAQAWLAFTGFANDAVQRKRELFTDDRFYDHAFKTRPIRHGFDYDYSFADSKKDPEIQPEAPLAEALLLSLLCNKIANALTPTMKMHRERSIQRLKLVGRKREDQDVALNEDSEWLAGLIRISASMLFTEFCGFVLFRAFGRETYRALPKILRQTDMKHVFVGVAADPIRDVVSQESPRPGQMDLFATLWLTFTYLTNSIAEDISWRNSFFQQSSRPRFLYSSDMRKRIRQYVDNFDARLKGVGMPLSWSSELEKQGGIFAYVKALPLS